MFGWLSLQLNWICSWSLDMMLWYLSFFERCLCTKTLTQWLTAVRQQGSCLWFQTQLHLSVNDGEILSGKGILIENVFINEIQMGLIKEKSLYFILIIIESIGMKWCATPMLGILHPKMKILSSFTHSRVDPNRHCISFSCGAQKKMS